MLLVEGTMRGLFSLLFGAGMILFLTSAERRSGTPAEGRRLMNRRLGWLFVFGVVNATVLLWPGDILIIYALAGILVLSFWRARPRLLGLAAGAVILGLSLWSASNQLPKQQWVEQGPSLEAQARAGAELGPQQRQNLEKWRQWQENRVNEPADVQAERAARLGSYAENFAFLANVSWEWFWDLRATSYWVLDAAALMLVGMLLFRLGWLQGDAARRTYWLLVLGGYGLGIPLKAIEASADWSLHVRMADPHFWQFILPPLTRQSARLLVTLGHLGLFLLVWKAIGRMRPLQALGRMAFTNYLLQSLLAALVFSGFGLGLWGSLNLIELWLVAAAIWAIQMAFAVSWLRRFSMGPLEWVWRALTYGRAPTASPAGAAAGSD
jgi:uncharacterized protein